MSKLKFEEGQTVRVCRKPTEQELDNWNDSWIFPMDNTVGKLYIIGRAIEQERGENSYYLKQTRYWYPECALSSPIGVGEQLLLWQD
jgi:hypothetical protein